MLDTKYALKNPVNTKGKTLFPSTDSHNPHDITGTTKLSRIEWKKPECKIAA